MRSALFRLRFEADRARHGDRRDVLDGIRVRALLHALDARGAEAQLALGVRIEHDHGQIFVHAEPLAVTSAADCVRPFLDQPVADSATPAAWLGFLAASTASVTGVALACDFECLGRFSVAYRARLGESPSATLGRRGDRDPLEGRVANTSAFRSERRRSDRERASAPAPKMDSAITQIG